MALNYNNRGVEDLSRGLIKSGLYKFEKAVSLSPGNSLFNQNYETTLFNLHSISGNYSEFIPFLKNAFWLIDQESYDPTNILIMLHKIIF